MTEKIQVEYHCVIINLQIDCKNYNCIITVLYISIKDSDIQKYV